jgi:hypothetical protein
MTVAIARKLTAMPLKDRPWNVHKGLTAGLNTVADTILADTNVFGDDFPALDKPKKSTVVSLLSSMHDSSLKAAEKYEEEVKNLKRDGPYTLVTVRCLKEM